MCGPAVCIELSSSSLFHTCCAKFRLRASNAYGPGTGRGSDARDASIGPGVAPGAARRHLLCHAQQGGLACGRVLERLAGGLDDAGRVEDSDEQAEAGVEREGGEGSDGLVEG